MEEIEVGRGGVRPAGYIYIQSGSKIYIYTPPSHLPPKTMLVMVSEIGADAAARGREHKGVCFCFGTGAERKTMTAGKNIGGGRVGGVWPAGYISLPVGQRI